ncbi:MAG: glycoside hydrolase family 32 protein [Chloroflexi bacterium]|nr:glycoside hydrolase family 32 protein [Chloroflexota bacterium]
MTDPHRPQYHFLPPANWMNDPNGLIQWKGQYHMYYQYNPNGAFHGTIHWGHAVSTDLVYWQHLPIALTPTPDGMDEDGCWSGCAIINNGIPTLFYTGVHPQVQIMATSSDDMLTWQKHPQPVISTPPPNIEAHAGGHIRDPFVWRENNHWYMLLGSKIEGSGGVVLLYRSDDLLNWEYIHPLLAGDVRKKEPFWTGTMWECPNLLTFGEKRALIISIQATPNDLLGAIYFTGTFEADQFSPDVQERLVYGNYFYAPQVMRAEDGRYIMWGWLREGRSPHLALDAGWDGVMSLPLELSLLPNGKLAVEPVPELSALRQENYHFDDLQITPATGLLENIQGDAFEIQVQFQSDLQTECGIILRSSSDGREQARVIYQPQQHRLVLERLNPNPEVHTDNHIAPLFLENHEPLTLRIFLDHSVVEVFANRKICLATRIYPSHESSNHLGVFAEDGMVKITSLDIWKLKDIWHE